MTADPVSFPATSTAPSGPSAPDAPLASAASADVGARPRLTIVVARAANGAIGLDNAMPWHLPEDLRHFRLLTTGHAVLMGRRTWASIGRALPNRRNLVLTRDASFFAEGAETVGSIGQAIERCRGLPELFVIGGAEVYAAALPDCDRAVVTEIDVEVQGDAFFEPLDPAQWCEVARDDRQSATGQRFAVVTWIRRGAQASGPMGCAVPPMPSP